MFAIMNVYIGNLKEENYGCIRLDYFRNYNISRTFFVDGIQRAYNT